MRNATEGEVRRTDDDLIVPITIRSCSINRLPSSSLFAFTIPIDVIAIVTTDVNLNVTPVDKIPCSPSGGMGHFLMGLLANAYVDFVLEVHWSEDSNNHYVDECTIVVPLEWCRAYCSPDHNRW